MEYIIYELNKLAQVLLNEIHIRISSSDLTVRNLSIPVLHNCTRKISNRNAISNIWHNKPTNLYLTDDVIVSVLVLSVVERGFEPQSGQTKDYEIGVW